MRFVTAACFGIAGILTGLLLGDALWGQHAANLARELAKTNGELVTTKGWLLDEMEWSDERHGQTSATLTKALAELVQARGELVMIPETRPRAAGVAPRLGYDNNWSASPNVNLQPR